MGRSKGEDIRELLVLSQRALGMIQTTFSAFLGVSDRTMRRWVDRGTRLTEGMLFDLTEAVHAKDPALAARLAAVHGRTLEELGVGLDPDQRVAHAMVCAAAGIAGVSVLAMRPALAAALESARAAGLTIEAAQALLGAPAGGKTRG